MAGRDASARIERMAPPSHLALAPEIEGFRQQFERLAAQADALVSPLSDEQFAWQPAPDVWSVAQCIEHLNTAARVYLPRIDATIADATRRGRYGEGPFRYGWLSRLMVRSMEPPVRLKLKTPVVYQPPPQRSRHEIMAAFRAYQVQFIDRLRQANGLDLAGVRVTSPVSALIRLPLGCAFALVTAHERRHLWQAQQVMQRAGFPGRNGSGPV